MSLKFLDSRFHGNDILEFIQRFLKYVVSNVSKFGEWGVAIGNLESLCVLCDLCG
jgi:hypothetical protein